MRHSVINLEAFLQQFAELDRFWPYKTSTLVVFDGADGDKTRVRWVAINLLPQSASDAIKTLHGIVKNWGLSDKRLKEQEHLSPDVVL